MKRLRIDAIPLAALVAFFLLLFRDALFGGRFLLVGDPLKQLYPLRMVAWDMIRSGTLPLWTPYILSGYPLGSMVMLGIGYPVTWGYLFLPGHWAEQLYVLAPYLLAPIFTYAFLRELGRSPVASMSGGLVFGYGGFLFSPIGLTGVHANSALWLPLHLLGIVRARRGSFVAPLLLSTAAYTMAILAGSGQIFLYTGSLALAWSGFLALLPVENGEPARRRWQPIAVAAGSIVLSAGLTAFQSLETWTAVGLSSRRAYPFDRFSEGSFPPALAFRSLLQPLGNFWDSSTFTPLLALALAIVAVAAAVRRPRLNPQIFFWLFAAIIAWLLILGNHTPLFRLYSYIPLVGRFRYPSRHSLEWTFCIGVLAAYGWDNVEMWLRARADSLRTMPVFVSGIAFVLLAGIAAVAWSRTIVARGLDKVADLNNTITQLSYPYLGWKLAFTLSIVAAIVVFCRLRDVHLRTTALAATVALCCFVEPYLWLVRPIIVPLSIPAERFGSFGETTHILRKLLGEHERNYSVVSPYAVPDAAVRDIDAVNWTALAHIRDINGYESLIFERYISALRGISGEIVDAEPFINPNPTLFNSKSRVLDLLNVRFVTAYTDLLAVPSERYVQDGVTFARADLGVDLPRDAPYSLSAGELEADTLAIVTWMGMSGDVPQGTPVARVTIHDVNGRVVERLLRAGIETSEWAFDRADVRATILHQRAPVFDSGPVDPQAGFAAHRFLGRIALGERMTVERVDIIGLTAKQASVSLAKVSLHDSATGQSAPLPRLSPARWQTVHDRNGVVILKNASALGAAWLVTKVEAAGKTEVLRRILGVSNVAFDPRTTALVEMSLQDVPKLSGEPLSPVSHVAITTHKPARIAVQTISPQPTMLVLSEIYYPGWVATVDGVAAPIHQTDYLLRGVFVPAGSHIVEMRYTAPGARKGGLISLASVMGIGLLFALRRRVTPR